MRLTNKKTNCILIKANTNSEWDYCEFAIVSFTDDELSQWLEYSKLIAGLKKNDGNVFRLTLWSAADFYKTDDDTPESITTFLQNELGRGWCYVEEVPDNLSVPENRLDVHQLKIDSTSFMFTCYGKHTSEEFYTHDIEFDEINAAEEFLSPCCQAETRPLNCEECKTNPDHECIEICTACGVEVPTVEDFDSQQADSRINLQKDENNHG